jgi:hypothetical protein
MTYKTGLASSSWDASALTGTVANYITTATSAAAALKPLMTAYDFTFRDNNGVVEFFHKGAGDTITVDANDLSVTLDVARDSPLYDISLESELNETRKTTVSFTDTQNEQQRGVSTHTRVNFLANDTEQTIDLLGLGLTHQQAREIAVRELFDIPNRWLKVDISLPPKYLGVRRYDVVNVPIDGDTHPLKVVSVEEQDNYRILLQTTSHADGIAYTTPDITTGDTKDNFIAEVDTHAWKSAALFYDHLQKPGFYVACSRTDDGEDWQGATLYKRIQTNDTPTYDWVPVLDIVEEGIVGRFVSEESKYWGSWSNSTSGPGSVFTWDTETELVVEIFNQDVTLESRTALEVLDGANRAMWGNELIGFQTITSLGGTKAKLTNLLRGMRDTLSDGLSEEYEEVFKNASASFGSLTTLAAHLPPDGTVKTGLEVLNVGGGGFNIECTAGGFLTMQTNENFDANSLIRVEGFANSENNGLWRIASIVSDTRLSIYDYDNTSINEGPVAGASVTLEPNRDKITIVTAEGVKFREESLIDIGKEGHYKMVPVNSEVDDAEEFIMDLRATVDYYLDYNASNRRGTLAPFSVETISVDSSGSPGWTEAQNAVDIDITITRRTRAIKQPLLAPVGPTEPNPLEEERELYEVKVYYTDVSPGTINAFLNRTLYNDPDSATPNVVTYTVADQTSDVGGGGGWGPIMRVEVWQISDSVGRGSIAAFEVASDGTVTVV